MEVLHSILKISIVIFTMAALIYITTKSELMSLYPSSPAFAVCFLKYSVTIGIFLTYLGKGINLPTYGKIDRKLFLFPFFWIL
jgi:hypothetical protein